MLVPADQRSPTTMSVDPGRLPPAVAYPLHLRPGNTDLPLLKQQGGDKRLPQGRIAIDLKSNCWDLRRHAMVCAAVALVSAAQTASVWTSWQRQLQEGRAPTEFT